MKLDYILEVSVERQQQKEIFSKPSPGQIPLPPLLVNFDKDKR